MALARTGCCMDYLNFVLTPRHPQGDVCKRLVEGHMLGCKGKEGKIQGEKVKCPGINGLHQAFVRDRKK